MLKSRLTLISLIGIWALGAAPSVYSAATSNSTSGGAAGAAVDASSQGMEEENGALERTIEGRVKDILNGIIEPDKYAVYVKVKMRSDPKVIQAYYDELALTTLPGIPAPDPSVNTPANNKLYSLIENKRMIVILDKAVSTDQEQIAKDVLKSKLAINEKKGDALDVRRAEVPTATARSLASSTVPVSVTESWVKYALIGLGIALAFAIGVLLWQLSLLKERVNARAKLQADISVDQQSNSVNQSSPPPPAETAEGDSSPESRKPANGSMVINGPEPVSLAEMKEKILSIAIANPKACSLVARRLLTTREGMHKLVVAAEAIGFEYTKQLFDSIRPDKWKAMGEYLRNNLSAITAAPVGQVLLEIYSEMLAESMAWDPAKNGEGPFDFLKKLSDSDLTKLFADEDPGHIAFIAAFWEPEEMTPILSVLPAEKRKQTVLQIARMKSLPKELVESAALEFSDRLKALKSRNEIDVNGGELIAKMLGTFDSTAEEELLKYIEREDPEASERLRSHYFTFDSLAVLPADLLKGLFESQSPDTIVRALAGADESIQQIVLEQLPSKIRSIVEDDLQIAKNQNTVSPQQASEARKMIVALAIKEVRARGLEYSELVEKAKVAEKKAA